MVVIHRLGNVCNLLVYQPAETAGAELFKIDRGSFSPETDWHNMQQPWDSPLGRQAIGVASGTQGSESRTRSMRVEHHAGCRPLREMLDTGKGEQQPPGGG
jgi:hypothetical protein